MPEFRYAIGDVLVHRGLLAAPVKKYPTRFFVTEREALECPGGTQLFYHGQMISDSETGMGRFLEQELAPLSEHTELLLAARREEAEMAKGMAVVARQLE